MTRVLVVSTSYPLRPQASAGAFVQSLVQAFPASVRTEVLCPGDDRGDAHAGLHVLRYAPRAWQVLAQSAGGMMPSLRARPVLALLLPVFAAAMAWKTFRLATRFDVLHANWAICGAIVGIAAALRGKPVVVTLRGSDVSLASGSRLHAALLAFAVRRSARVVCVSEAMAAEVRRLFPERSARVSVILNGVDEQFLQLPEKSDGGDRAMHLLAIGSLVKGKGFEVLLHALARLRRQDWDLALVGEGPEQARLAELAQALGISERVRFAGGLPPSEIPGVFAKSDLFVMTSFSEGRSNVVLEAMAAAMPVVATRIPGVLELATDGEHGWLVPPGDTGVLAASLEEAMAQAGERRRRGLAARQKVILAGWTWAAAGEAYAALFQGLLANQTKAA